MPVPKFAQYNETDQLQKVIIGRWKGYRADENYVEIVNEEQKSGLPETLQLEKEFDGFKKALEQEGVEVLIPDYVGKFVYDQLTPRDIGITIGNRFVLCNMKSSSRRYESNGIFRHIMDLEGPEPSLLIPPSNDILLEGGDIIVQNGNIFVGISQRSNMAGFEYLKEKFGQEFDVIPLHCSSLDADENVLHLDCTFNPVGKKHALIYPDGFKEIPDVIRTFDWIEVTKEEQSALGTNVLSVNEQTVISRKHPTCTRVNEEIRKIGMKVIELPFDGAPSTGGSFRCCSLPLVRSF